MFTHRSLAAVVSGLATILSTGAAAAQETPATEAEPPPPPVEAAATAPPTAATVAAAPTAPAAAAQETPATEAEPPPPAEPAAQEPTIPGFFRVDSDGFGLQLWAGATHSLGPVDLASDIYVTSGTFGEIDVGPVISVGPLVLTPMIGIGFDWAEQRAVSLIPQLYPTLTVGPVYFESWNQIFVNSVFERGADNDFYTRNFLLLQLLAELAVGPQLEATLALNNGRDALVSLPVGGHVNVQYGPADRIELFLGYETQRAARRVDTGSVDAAGLPVLADRGLVGRLTYVHAW